MPSYVYSYILSCIYKHIYLLVCNNEMRESFLRLLPPVVMGYLLKKKKNMPEECENFIMPVPSVSSH